MFKLTEYTICAKRFADDEFYHSWYLGTNLKAEENEIANLSVVFYNKLSNAFGNP